MLKEAQENARWLKQHIQRTANPGHAGVATAGTYYGGRGIQGRDNTLHMTYYDADTGSNLQLGVFGLVGGADAVFGP